MTGMKKIKTIGMVYLLATFFTLTAAGRFIPENGRFETRFLIVIDTESFEEVSKEVLAYKTVLEEEGLGVVVMIGNWDNPETLREEIRQIYRRKPVMEGAVFIGDIPVVRLRNFQHATTAFKMNEKEFPIEESSVTSDRFYDDLDLEFRFLSVDEKNPHHFYYELTERSPQVVESEFYSARMLPPSDMGEGAHEQLGKYLRKVVEAHREVNHADRIRFFNGHGYNSDCLTAWHNQQFAIREQFPDAFRTADGNAFYNFRQDPFMKYRLYERLQAPGTDLFVFHEHGAFDTQYINGPYPAPNQLGMGREGATGPLEILSASLRNSYRRYSGKRREAFGKKVMNDYALMSGFFAPERLDSTRVSDSLLAAGINMVLADIGTLHPQPRITIFDACYNGSFHQPGYVAGYHIFVGGKTVVTQGNTVNVLQDKWSMELIGMLAEGVRIGFWQKEIQTLESHLIGDPTYRLLPVTNEDDAINRARLLNRDLALNRHKSGVWQDYLQSENPNLQSLALKMLSHRPPKGYPELLLRYLRESPYYSVRMQALQRILYSTGSYLAEALLLALDDSYELIRRNGARFAGYHGDDRLIAPLVETVLFSDESQRVQYAAQGSLPMFSLEKIREEIGRQTAGSNLTKPDEVAGKMTAYFEGQAKRYDRSLAVMQDKGADPKERISAIRFLRNYNNHRQVPSLLTILKDQGDETEVRVVLAEALGWFRWSVQKETIVQALKEVGKNRATPQELRDEIEQSLVRLRF
jgi:hypothetical protein